MEFKTLKMAVYKIKHDSMKYDLVMVYRLQSASIIELCDEIVLFIENNVVNLKGEVIMIGESTSELINWRIWILSHSQAFPVD